MERIPPSRKLKQAIDQMLDPTLTVIFLSQLQNDHPAALDNAEV